MTDLPFISFAFPATGATANRTMPARLIDVINVKDWGAVGTGADDRAAIQAAIDYIVTPPRTGGQIFFPPGVYLVGAPLIVGSAYDVGVELIGSGKKSTNIGKHGTYSAGGNDYVISGGTGGVPTYDNLARVSGFSQVNIKATRTGVVIENCDCAAGDDNIACNVVDASNAAVRGCESNEPPSGGGLPANLATPTGPHLTGSICFAMGSGVISGCRTVGGYEVGIAFGANGCVLTGCSIEVCNIGVRVGWGPDGAGGVHEIAVKGCVLQGFQTEKCGVGVDVYNATGCYISGLFTSGTIGTADPATISDAVWSATAGGTVTVQTAAAHNIGSFASPHRIQVGMTNTAWSAPNTHSHPATNTSFAEVTVVDATHFSYLHPVDCSAATPRTGIWTWPTTYDIRCRKVYNCVFASTTNQTVCVKATLDLAYDGTADHLNNVFIGGQNGFGVEIPTSANRAAWQFIRTVGDLNFWNDATVAATPYLYMVYADLPGESGVAQPRVEGQEFYITAQKSGGGAATWGDTVAAGVVGRYLVRYNSSNWIRIG